jgi:hypothetical protein
MAVKTPLGSNPNMTGKKSDIQIQERSLTCMITEAIFRFPVSLLLLLS